jgi:predicted PurR-regulated permease PerM
MKEIISNPWVMLVAGIIIGIIIHILYEKLVSRSANKELVKVSVSAIIIYVAFCSVFFLLNYIAKCCSS